MRELEAFLRSLTVAERETLIKKLLWMAQHPETKPSS